VGSQQNPCKYQYLQGFLIKKLSNKLSKTECSTFFTSLFWGDLGVILVLNANSLECLEVNQITKFININTLTSINLN
jgi:hypothetical protein